MLQSESNMRVLFALLLFIISPNINAEPLIMSAAPRETPQQGYKIYNPLVEHLSRLIGTEVKYKHPKHWLRYQSDIKKQKYDFVFDGPHLASWRIKHLKHQPLVKLPGTLGFYMLARADDQKINKPEDLVYKKVCAIPPPNLTSVTLLQRLNDPIREPIIESVKGGMGKIYKSLIEGKCEGAVIRTAFYKGKLSAEQKAKVKIIYTSPEIPNQVITASERISAEDKKRIIASLTSDEGMQAMAPILKRFGGKARAFIPADPREYDGYNTFLEGVVLGW